MNYKAGLYCSQIEILITFDKINNSDEKTTLRRSFTKMIISQHLFRTGLKDILSKTDIRDFLTLILRIKNSFMYLIQLEFLFSRFTMICLASLNI